MSGAARLSGRAVTRDDRDVAAFDARAAGYEGGWLGRLHRQIAGVDPAPAMIGAARAAAADDRLHWLEGTAGALPFPDGAFDLVVSTTSFDHWADQAAGLRECARVLAPGGRPVLTDLFSPLLLPTLVGGRRRAPGRRRTRARRWRRTARRPVSPSPDWSPG